VLTVKEIAKEALLLPAEDRRELIKLLVDSLVPAEPERSIKRDRTLKFCRVGNDI